MPWQLLVHLWFRVIPTRPSYLQYSTGILDEGLFLDFAYIIRGLLLMFTISISGHSALLPQEDHEEIQIINHLQDASLGD